MSLPTVQESTYLLLFISHNKGLTWTRAAIPNGVRTPQEMVSYIRRGGQLAPIKENLMDIPARAQFTPYIVGRSATVVARLTE